MGTDRNSHNIEVDLILLGARGKMLAIVRTNDGFGALVLDKADYDRLVLERPHFTAKTIDKATQMARQAVEAGKA